jgi:hypothetical protein
VWNPELWQRCYDLVGENWDNEVLRYVHDDLILVGFRVKPPPLRTRALSPEFRDIGAALRSPMSLGEAKKKYDLWFGG